MYLDWLIALIKAALLAAIQGFTEIFPVSSSGHLIILSSILGIEITFLDILLYHLGTLLAIAIFFRQDLLEILRLKFGWQLPAKLILSFIITGIVGLAMRAGIVPLLVNQPEQVAGVLIINGAFLFFFANKNTVGQRKFSELQWSEFIFLGIIQGFAAIPGISRLGMTLGLGLLIGMSWREALKLSFLLSIPTLLFANLFELFAINPQSQAALSNSLIFGFQQQTAGIVLTWMMLFLIVLLVGLGSLHMLLKNFSKPMLNYIAVYCLSAGVFYTLFFQLF